MIALTETTRGIRISVRAQYQIEHSNPMEHKYVFAYQITIENGSDYTIQVLRRHWTIVDAGGNVRTVDGEGIVGEQPIIAPNASYQYTSWAGLSSDIGKMFGTYLVERQIDGENFDVKIPEFALLAPFKLN